jgi:hypothetical protein
MKRTVLVLILSMALPLLSQGNKGTAIPDGYGELTWGTALKDARDKIKGKIYFTDDEKVIQTKDGNLSYHYGFLHLDMTLLPKTDDKEPQKVEEANGKLFYVALKFPYLAYEDVKKKITERYGESTFDNVKKNHGYVTWVSEKTILILWVDQYEKKPFCRRITYISKDIVKELNDYVEKIFTKPEIEVLQKLTP